MAETPAKEGPRSTGPLAVRNQVVEIGTAFVRPKRNPPLVTRAECLEGSREGRNRAHAARSKSSLPTSRSRTVHAGADARGLGTVRRAARAAGRTARRDDRGPSASTAPANTRDGKDGGGPSAATRRETRGPRIAIRGNPELDSGIWRTVRTNSKLVFGWQTSVQAHSPGTRLGASGSSREPREDQPERRALSR